LYVRVMKLRDYQEDAADFLYEHDRAMVLASVGAGKTAIALTAMHEMLRDGYVTRWLVLAPKRVCTDVWPDECKKWAPGLSLSVAVGSPKERRDAFLSDTDVVVTNYDNIQSLDTLDGFDGIVFDELTRLKTVGNPRSLKKTLQKKGVRFEHLWRLIPHINIRWGLTGSFTSNGLEDVFGQCRMIDDNLLGVAKTRFLQQYFVCINRGHGEWVPRAGALECVMDRIKPSTYLLENKEYKDKLPPLHTVDLRCNLDDRGPYEEMKKKFVVELNGKIITALSAAAVTNKLQQGSSGFFYQTTNVAGNNKMVTETTPHWFSSHKFDRLDELLQENQRANTIIVYNFIEELAELKRRYPHAVGMDDKQAVEKWNAGRVELLLIHPKSAGHGLNLQHGGSKIVFLSLPWSLELYEQTIGRLHRSGQRHAVWVYILMTTKTIDERIWASLHDKQAIAELAIEELKS